MHDDANGATNCRARPQVDLGIAQHPSSGVRRRVRIAIDARGARSFACCVDNPDVVPNDERGLENGQEQEDDERKDECELDRGLSPFPETGHGPNPPKRTAH